MIIDAIDVMEDVVLPIPLVSPESLMLIVVEGVAAVPAAASSVPAIDDVVELAAASPALGVGEASVGDSVAAAGEVVDSPSPPEAAAA